THHAEADIGIGNSSPALDVLVADRNEARLDQQFSLSRLEQQRVAGFLRWVAPPDQVDDLLLVRQRIVPALQAGRAKRLHPLRMLRDLLFRGAEIVTIEVEPKVARREGQVWRAQLFEGVRLVGAVTDHYIGGAVEQVARISVMSDARKAR